ncbi:MAG: PD40 domain-containing protein [Candidatus Aenigmarchaeota archaeon]|nr:PD40 domain-containing protein [Candidatus Aenigmarchaeota archaeon]
MKIKFLFGVLLLLIVACSKKETPNPNTNSTLTVLTGEYLGQTPPGSTPVLFGSGTISSPDYFEHSAAVFSPDKTEVYWSAKPNGGNIFIIYFMKIENGVWTAPEVASFSQNVDQNTPVFSPDGNKLYYHSENAIWVVERQNNSWSTASRLPAIINTNAGVFRVHGITANGSIYFSRNNPNETLLGRYTEVCVSRYINGEYTEPEQLEENINSEWMEASIYIAPDESFMLIEEIRDGIVSGIYISYKMQNNSWSERIDLHLGFARFPHISPDGQYLFFMRREGIYWMNTSFIENLRPEE